MEFIKVVSIWYLVRIAFIILLGFPSLLFFSKIIKSTLSKRVSPHIGMLVSNIGFYAGLCLLAITVLQESGFNISALLGAAGVVGVAVGFAAKTTISNIISGIFLLLERPFIVGDRISCGGYIGIVESIDLMSVKMRTLNGQLVRIPNETLVTQSMTNISFYPKRRLIFKAEIKPDQDLPAILQFLEEMVGQDSCVIQDPKPIVTVKEYSQYAVEIMIRVWVKQKDISFIYPELVEKINNYGKSNGIWIGLTQEN